MVKETDLHEYFAIYQQYANSEDMAIVGELDNRLSRYKDLFHKNAAAVLQLLSEKQGDFIGQYEAAYKDLVFDLQMHAKSLEDIKRTHTYDRERDVWVPK
jgi:hypothetical protein